ncbi:hypothetical protein QP938_05905 [Porticoccaceae bacterium LTM1]|nr:hypothetical protein QP938_05905 [Porticoccaceae bacterium LTM1]
MIKIILSSLVVSVFISAVITFASVSTSTVEASENLASLELAEEELSDLSEKMGISVEEIKEGFEQAKTSDSPFNYPGFYRYWFQAFLWVFTACFASSLIQSYLVVSQFNKTKQVGTP